MTTLEVRPADLRAAGADMRLIGATVSKASSQASTYVQVEGGGAVYDAIGSEIQGVREDMLAAYGPAGLAEGVFYGAGDALSALAYDYEQVDLEQAQRYDELLTPVEPRDMTSQWTPDPVGTDQAGLLGLVSGSPSDQFADYNAFDAINEKVDNLLGFEWVGEALGKLGIDFKPTELIEAELGGDWTQMGVALGGIDQIHFYWLEVSYELEGVVSRFDATWKGQAANAARAWFAVLQGSAFDHGTALGKSGSRVKAESIAFLDALSTLEKAVDAVAGMAASSDNLGGGILSVLKGVVDAALGKLMGLIDAFWAAFQAMKTVAHGLVAAMAQFTRFHDTTWPAVPGFPEQDVDGPEL